MKKVRINVYKNKRAQRIMIEVPDNLKPSEVMILASKALDDEQRACLWDWEYIHEKKPS